MCPEDFFRERLFGRTFFGLQAVNLAIFGETTIEYLSKPFSTVFVDFLEKDFWIKKLYTFIFLNSGFWQKIFMQLSIKNSAGMSKLQCTSPADYFVEKHVFLGRKLWSLVDFERKIPNFVGNCFSRLTKVHSKCPVDIFGNSFWKFPLLFFFEVWARPFWTLGIIFPARVSILFFESPEEHTFTETKLTFRNLK